eukprot:scaffold88250_cov48-Phaeocystis_antarctica.AAC.3
MHLVGGRARVLGLVVGLGRRAKARPRSRVRVRVGVRAPSRCCTTWRAADHCKVGDQQGHEAYGGCLGAILGGHAHLARLG